MYSVTILLLLGAKISEMALHICEFVQIMVVVAKFDCNSIYDVVGSGLLINFPNKDMSG